MGSWLAPHLCIEPLLRVSRAYPNTKKIGDPFCVSALLKGPEEAMGSVVVARYGVSAVEAVRVTLNTNIPMSGMPLVRMVWYTTLVGSV